MVECAIAHECQQTDVPGRTADRRKWDAKLDARRNVGRVVFPFHERKLVVDCATDPQRVAIVERQAQIDDVVELAMIAVVRKHSADFVRRNVQRELELPRKAAVAAIVIASAGAEGIVAIDQLALAKPVECIGREQGLRIAGIAERLDWKVAQVRIVGVPQHPRFTPGCELVTQRANRARGAISQFGKVGANRPKLRTRIGTKVHLPQVVFILVDRAVGRLQVLHRPGWITWRS